MSKVCRNIRYLRKYYHLTQKEMADILGFSVSSLQRLERGMMPRCFNSRAIRRVCDHFQISADYILREDIEKNPAP